MKLPVSCSVSPLLVRVLLSGIALGCSSAPAGNNNGTSQAGSAGTGVINNAGSGGQSMNNGGGAGGMGPVGSVGGNSGAPMNQAGNGPGPGEGGMGPGAGGMLNEGGMPGTAGAGTAGSGGMLVNTGCSEEVLRTGPPAGKEALASEPIDGQFPFSAHWMGEFGETPSAVGITSLQDFDLDGDLDFASGRRGGGMYWYEYCSADHWVRHPIGTGHNSPGGGNALDVNADGWPDVIAGDSWYENPQDPRISMEWTRHVIGDFPGAEDVAVGDVNGDAKADALFVWNPYDAFWAAPGTDPTAPWPVGATMENRQVQGGAIGDLDGDGDNDIVVGNQWWYRNTMGDGSQWETVAIAQGFDDSPLVAIGDLDGDGDNDLAMITHFGPRLAWVENGDANGTAWTLRPIAEGKAQLHAVFIVDFDNDGDTDIYAGENSGSAFVFENTDGQGTFVEHVVASNAKGHDARVGDVDCDGDMDITGKPWGEGDADPRDHVYLKNLAVENGAPALLTRPAGEVWHPIHQRACPAP